MDPIVAFIFLILFFTVIFLFSKYLIPLIVIFILYWWIKSIINSFRKPKKPTDFHYQDTQSTYSQSQGTRTHSARPNGDVFDAEFETREIPDDQS